MELFHEIPDGCAIVRMKHGLHKQAKIYRRASHVYIGVSGGFVRVRTGHAEVRHLLANSEPEHNGGRHIRKRLMAFVPCHVWVTMNGRNFKVVFEESGRPSHIMEWKGRAVYTRYWYGAPRRRRPREGGLAARIIAAAEEIRG